MKSQTRYDAIVVGGGPAGATTATILAEHGREVLLLERERFPRYHIGESLMPYTWFTFKRLGVLEWLKQSGSPIKHSVQFVSTSGKVSEPFYFFETIKHECASTWQILRSDFDAMMLRNATQKGADVKEGVVVRDVLMEHDRAVGVQATTNGGDTTIYRAPVVVDATGRDALLASRLGWKRRDADLNKIAIFTYFSGARRDPGLDEGATTVAYIPEKGWFWYVPLVNDMVSVGVVAEHDYLYRDSRNPEEIFWREAADCRWIREHLEPGTHQGPVRVTGEFSYRATATAGEGFCLVGDAFSFLDPVFSSGVFMALKSGELAADAIHGGLKEGVVTTSTFDQYGRDVRYALDSFRQLVVAFYDRAFNFGEFIGTYPDLQPRLVDTLVGNVFTDLEPLFDALSRYTRPTQTTSSNTTGH
ncbi:MAG: NAD(P)/FAD-dependent oxidoreductase [Acidobacteriota bacterium]|nr:NAD(P)/FAD-dependent oxidoreductase [Acidobacteriota bacterium]